MGAVSGGGWRSVAVGGGGAARRGAGRYIQSKANGSLVRVTGSESQIIFRLNRVGVVVVAVGTGRKVVGRGSGRRSGTMEVGRRRDRRFRNEIFLSISFKNLFYLLFYYISKMIFDN